MAHENNDRPVRTLHARLADAVAGYRDGIDRTTSETVAAYFETYRALHDSHTVELARAMLSSGMKPRIGRSWETLPHTGMMAFRASVDRLDAGVTGAVTRGERMLADLYDDALESVEAGSAMQAVLMRQRAELADPFDHGSIREAA